MLRIARIGYYLVAGNVLREERGIATFVVQGLVRNSTLLPAIEEVVEIRSNLLLPVETESLKVGESGPAPVLFESLLHASIMPHVATLRNLSFHKSSLVAYEHGEGSRGLGFLTEDRRVKWASPKQALRHSGLANFLALEALRGRLVSHGIAEVGYQGRADRISRVLEQHSLHVYMKPSPFKDVTRIYKGTQIEVRKYANGCALVEADGEPFWHPIDEPYYVLPNKDDSYYFSMDADNDGIPDPLSMLPSKLGLRAVAGGQARAADNYNSTPDMSTVAGNFYAASWLGPPPPASDPLWLGSSPPPDPVTAIHEGIDIDTLLDSLRKS
jgi:hypothetical protein